MAVTYTDEELDRRKRASFATMLRLFAAGHPDSSLIELPGGVLGSCVPVSPQRSLLNSVMFGDDPRALIDALPELQDTYESAGVRAWTVWLHHPGNPAHAPVRDALVAAGHKLDADPRAMGAPIAEISLDPAPLPTGLAIDECTWPEVALTNELAYGVPPDSFLPALAGIAPDPANALVGIRKVDGEVVSCGVFLEDGDNAEVTFIATLPEWRGKGLAGQVMRHGLATAQARGCATATLDATKAGEPVYAALGYRSFDPVEMWERRW